MAARIRQHRGSRVIYTMDERWRPSSIYLDRMRWERCLRGAELNFHFALDLDFTEVLQNNASTALPKAEVVTKVSLLRKTIHNFEPTALAAILQCFPSAKDFDLELWPRSARQVKQLFDSRLAETLNSWNPSLERVCIHQVQGYYFANHRRPTYNPYLTPLGKTLAQLCQQLKHLSVSYSIDANAFFCYKYPTMARSRNIDFTIESFYHRRGAKPDQGCSLRRTSDA